MLCMCVKDVSHERLCLFVCAENCLQYDLIELNVPKHIPGTNICYLKRVRRRWIQSITLIFLIFFAE